MALARPCLCLAARKRGSFWDLPLRGDGILFFESWIEQMSDYRSVKHRYEYLRRCILTKSVYSVAL